MSILSSRAEPGEETPDLYGAFPRLSEEQIAALRHSGTVRSTQQDEVLFRAGERNCDFFVVLSGTVAVIDGFETPHEHTVALHGPGRFLGEIDLVIGRASLVTAVVRQPGAVLQVPMEAIRQVVTENRALGDLILRACLIRRSLLIELGTGVKILGSRYSPSTRRLLEFLARNRVPYRWFDIEDDEQAETLLRQFGVTPNETPVVVFGANEVLRNPSIVETARALGLPVPASQRATADFVVVGAGPAGLAAAVYGASEGLSTFVVEAIAPGGQAGTSSRIENYLGFPAGISGAELAERALIQAEKFGSHLTAPAEAITLERRGTDHVVTVAGGGELIARAVLIATGARYRRLGLPRLEQFEGTCVHYAATEVEARLCAGDVLAVVGGGNSAGQATLYLARQAAVVHLLVRESDLATSMSRYLVDRIEQCSNVQVHLSVEVRALIGEAQLEGVVVDGTSAGETETVPARYLFVFIGAEPNAGWLGDEVQLDSHGFVRTGTAVVATGETSGPSLGHQPSFLETSCTGVFAAGDIRSGSIKRVASAVGEGAMAVRLVHQYLSAGMRSA